MVVRSLPVRRPTRLGARSSPGPVSSASSWYSPASVSSLGGPSSLNRRVVVLVAVWPVPLRRRMPDPGARRCPDRPLGLGWCAFGAAEVRPFRCPWSRCVHLASRVERGSSCPMCIRLVLAFGVYCLLWARSTALLHHVMGLSGLLRVQQHTAITEQDRPRCKRHRRLIYANRWNNPTDRHAQRSRDDDRLIVCRTHYRGAVNCSLVTPLRHRGEGPRADVSGQRSTYKAYGGLHTTLSQYRRARLHNNTVNFGGFSVKKKGEKDRAR